LFPYVKIYRGPRGAESTPLYDKYSIAEGKMKREKYHAFRDSRGHMTWPTSYTSSSKIASEPIDLVEDNRSVKATGEPGAVYLHLIAEDTSQKHWAVSAILFAHLEQPNRVYRVKSNTIEDAFLQANDDVILRFVMQSMDNIDEKDALNKLVSLSASNPSSSAILPLQLALIDPSLITEAVSGIEAPVVGKNHSARYIHQLEIQLQQYREQAERGAIHVDSLEQDSIAVTWDIYLLLGMLLILAAYLGAQLLHVLGITTSTSSRRAHSRGLPGFDRPTVVKMRAV
jgi:hypothetical protein